MIPPLIDRRPGRLALGQTLLPRPTEVSFATNETIE